MTGPDRTEGTAVLSDEERETLLQQIKWRLDHYGPLDAEPFRYSRFESPAHAALDAMEGWLLAARAALPGTADTGAREAVEALAGFDDETGHRLGCLGNGPCVCASDLYDVAAALADAPDGHQHAAEES